MGEGMAFMQVPQWAKKGQDTFWRRHYEFATIAEQSCEQAIEQQLQTWLMQIELTDGPAAKEQD
jgi:hypothetical protein